MSDFWSGLLRADFLPHGWCYRWDPTVVLLHVTSDLLIALAYYFIPFALIYIIRRRGDFAYPWMFWLFGTFILACGTTHLMGVLVVWQPWYRLDGIVKLITALASVPTAILLIRIAPAVIALPSPAQLRSMNGQLAQEIAERRVAEEEVRRLNADLERRVSERTAELEATNAKLRESENRLRSILDSSPALVYLKDLEGRYVLVNREFEMLFDMHRDEIIGKTDSDLFPRTLAESYAAADREVIRAVEPMQFEELAVPNGQPRMFMSIKFPLVNISGNVYAVCGISSDITERKQAEEALRKYNQDLEQFAYIAAHDLQEPLRTVRSYTQLLERRYGTLLEGDGKEFMGYIRSGVDRIQSLIAGLQSYSEIDRERRGTQAISVREALEDTVQAMSSSIEEAGAVIDVTSALPSVRINRVHLQQLLQNFIGNAIKYRAPGRPPKIELFCRRGTVDCEFVVRDNGIGIDMRYAEQIFKVFRRLHGADIPGTGIGLAICKKVVETYGGRVWVESQLGEGSEFHFTLPC